MSSATSSIDLAASVDREITLVIDTSMWSGVDTTRSARTATSIILLEVFPVMTSRLITIPPARSHIICGSTMSESPGDDLIGVTSKYNSLSTAAL